MDVVLTKRYSGGWTAIVGYTYSHTKVDLTKEQVGKPPVALEPMVGSWVIAQDGAEKVVMVDGRPCAKAGREYRPNPRLTSVR